MKIKDNKIILEEKLFLTEAFSESMPSWLRKSLEIDSAYDRGRYGSERTSKERARQDVTAGAKYKQSSDPEYKAFLNPAGRNRGFDGRGITDSTLLAALSRTGIDLSKATFLTAEVPKKFSDPRLQWPDGQYIGFLYLKTDDFKSYGSAYTQTQVYAPGVNDTERSILRDRKGDYRTLRYVSRPEILAHAQAFCYVDMTDPNNLIGDKWDKRAQIDADNRENRANTRLKPDELNWREKIDKSGYLIDPNKYKDKLSKLGLDGARTQAKIAEIYKSINDLYRDATSALADFDYINDIASIRSVISPLDRQLNYATDYYNRMMSCVSDYTQTTDQYYKDNYSNQFRNSYDKAKTYIKEASRILDKYITQEVDWDNPE